MPELLLRGQPIGAIEAVLFDKDGTLSHSEPGLLALSRARVKACLAHVPAVMREQFQTLLERAYGLNDNQLDPAGTTAVASRQHNLISTATTFCQVGLGWPEALAHSEAVFDRVDHEIGEGSPADQQPLAPLTEGAESLLTMLHQNGLRLAVISNDTSNGIRRFLQGHGLNDLFQEIWSADLLPAKPDPEAVHRLCASLGIPPANCALIGDASSDLRMAEAAGVGLTLGYTAGWSTAPPLQHHLPRIGHWRELTVVQRPETAPSAKPGDKLSPPEVGARRDEPLRLHV